MFGKYKRKIIAGIIVLVAVLVVSVGIIAFLSKVHYKSRVAIDGKVFMVDIADTDYLLQKGLSGRSLIFNDKGMLFAFKKPDTYGFWMKDMLFAIDILWIDENLKIVYIEKAVSPQSYPKIFTPDQKSLYVLELAPGQSDILNIKIGDSVQIIKRYL